MIPARGGSKSIPRKNIRLLAGKPLIVYSIETALASKLIDRVIVSTDDDEIAYIATQFGAEVPFIRPMELASDDSPEWLTWQHSIRTMKELEPDIEFETFVCVSPTSPLRSVEDLDNCILTLFTTETDLVMAVTHSNRNPYFNMVTLDDDGNAKIAIPTNRIVTRRQEAPKVYDATTVAYAARAEFVLKASSFFEGNVKGVIVPEQRAVDIDTELDFQFVEFLMWQKMNNKLI